MDTEGCLEQDCWRTLFLARVAGDLGLKGVLWATGAASCDRVGWRAGAAAHVGELAGDTGTPSGLVKVETMQGTGASRGATGGVSNGTITLALVGARRIFSSRERSKGR